MLPEVAERGHGDRIRRERDDTGRHRRLLLRASGGRAQAFYVPTSSAAAGIPPDGPKARRIRLFGALW